MAKLTNNRAKATIAKEQKRLDAIQKKMEIQRKKEEFGESWKYSLKDEHKQALKEIVGDFGTPNLVDSVDYNTFFDPINFYKEEDGSVRQLDYKKYLEYEEAYQEVIDDCDKIINDENLLNPQQGYNVYADLQNNRGRHKKDDVFKFGVKMLF